MKWLSNIYDPEKNDARNLLSIPADQTRQQAWANHLQWLRGKHIGLPKQMQRHTVSELIEMDMVGVYLDEAE